jgi:hypothetical protein
MKKLMSCLAASVAILLLLSSVGFSATIVKTFRDGTDGYTGTTDTYVDIENQDAVPSNNQRLNINFGGGEHTEALIRFDLSSIPSYATVTSANLILTETRIGENDLNDVIILDQVTSAWSETVTWNTRPSSTPTSIITPAIDSIAPDSTNSYPITGLGSLVQSWVTNSASNFGIKLSATNDTVNFRVSSREDATESFRPALEVTYSVPDPELTLIVVTPSSSTVAKLGTLQYSAIAFDQFGVAMTGVTFTWSVTGAAGTTIDSSGLLTAGSVPGSYTVKASSSTVEGTTAGEVRLGGTLVFQNGLNGYTGTEDTYLNQLSSATNGASGSLYVSRLTNSSGTVTSFRQTLLRFDLASGLIPTNAVITSAILTLVNVSKTGTDASDIVNMGIVTSPWNEFHRYVDGVPSSTNSGVTLPNGAALIGANARYISSNMSTVVQGNMSTVVQGWVSVPPNNKGLIFDTTSHMEARFESSEGLSTNRPKLEVSYILPAQVLTSVGITPTGKVVANGSTQTFVATAYDQAGNLMDPQPASFTWNVTGGGTINSAGTFTASTPGAYTVSASTGDKTGSANFEVGTVLILRDGLDSYAGTTDVYVDQLSPTNSFGTLDRIAADRWTTTTITGSETNVVITEMKQSFLKFDLSQIPTNATVHTANLVLTMNKITSASSSEVIIFQKANSSWDETVTWDSAPTSTDLGIAKSPSGYSVGGAFTVSNLANLVQGWVSGSEANNGLKIFTTNTAIINFRFNSREHATATSRPTLQIVYTSPASGSGDSDSDGLLDSWEIDQFGILSYGKDDDVDGDGLTNIQEYSAGTAGNSAADRFVASNQGFISSDFTITWSSVIGHDYTVEASSDLVTWSPAGVVLNVPTTSTSWSDVAPTETKKFYRVKTQ